MEYWVDSEDLFGDDGLLKRMKKRMAERVLEPELTDHLGCEKHAPDGRNRGNSRNGKTMKTLKDDLPVEIPRNREGSFDPKLIRKYQTPWPDFDDDYANRTRAAAAARMRVDRDLNAEDLKVPVS